MISRFSSGISLGITAIILVLGFILSWHFFGRMDPYNALIPSAQANAQPIQLTDVEIHTRSHGVLTGQLHASSLIISPDRRSVYGNGLTDGIFYKNKHPLVYFTAPFVQYSAPTFSEKQLVHINGGVNIWTRGDSPQSPIAVHVQTASIDWDGTSGIVSCPNPVSFTARNLGSGIGSGLKIDTKRNAIYFGKVNGKIAATLADDIAAPQSVPASAAAPAAKPTPEDNQVSYKIGGHGRWSGDENILTVDGPVTFLQGKAKVDMVGAVYNRTTDTADSSSPITITDTDTTVTGDHGSINFSSHVAILQGHIKMAILPKSEDKVSEPEVKKPTTILCDQINYNYRAKKAHTIGGVIIKQPTSGRTVTADIGFYDASTKIVDLDGHVIGKSTDGKIVKTPHAKLSIDPKDEWLDATGPITGVIPVNDADNPATPAPPAKNGKPDTPTDSTPTKH